MLRTPLVLISTVLFLILGIGIPPAISALQAHFEKASIDLRAPLNTFDLDALPSWVPDEGPAPFADPRAIGTDEYVYRAFLPRPRTVKARPKELVTLLVTYYSDPHDTIPHTPEVCYRQAGTIVDELTTTELDLPGLGPTTVRVLDMTQRGQPMIVVYFLYHNGAAYYDRETARLAMGMPGDRFTYFTKVEAVSGVFAGVDREEVIRRCSSMVVEALAELQSRHLPANEDLR